MMVYAWNLFRDGHVEDFGGDGFNMLERFDVEDAHGKLLMDNILTANKSVANVLWGMF